MKIIRFFKKIIRCIMNKYPLTACHFMVEWGGENIGFMEVSGLTIQHDIIEYREGSSPNISPTKMPGIAKYSNLVLKRGITKGDNSFYEWINTIKLNNVERRDVIIKLLDEEHNPVMVWKAVNAWPVKLEGPSLNSESSDVAIETLELAHEGLTIEND